MTRTCTKGIALILITVLLAGTGAADEQSSIQSGRRLMHTYASAVVQVGATTVVEAAPMGRREERNDCLGVIIAPSGLTMVSLGYFDQSRLITSAIQRKSPDVIPSVAVKDIVVTLPDDTDIPARLVFKDPDMDLAFVLPDADKAAEHGPFTCITMQGQATADILDRVFILGRLEETYDHAPIILWEYVASVLKKPRTFYYVKGLVPGSAVFKEDGSLLGVAVTQFSEAVGPSSLRTLVLPIHDVQGVAQQAMEAAAQQGGTD